MRFRIFILLALFVLPITLFSVACGGDPQDTETVTEKFDETTPSEGKSTNENTQHEKVEDAGPSDTVPSDAGPNDAGMNDTIADDGGAGDAMPQDGPVKPKMTDLKDMKAKTWYEQIPGGKTICSRGTEFAFYVRPGTVNKVLIDFEGGGACWNAGTCSIGKGQVFKDSIDNIRKIFTGQKAYDKGIYNHEHKDNPFKDWHHVFIPYCTGDIHWGNNYVEYKDKGKVVAKIHHKGAVNTQAVLKWVFANVTSPEQVFITGCSAGAYGSIAWSPHIVKQYENVAKVMQMGDCGAGVITKNFLKDSFPQWKAQQSLPSWIPTLDPAKVDITDKDFAYLYTSISNHYKNFFFSQYNTLKDENQTFYFNLMGGGNADEWSKKMMASIKGILDNTTNFRAFIAPGKKHCVIPYDEFYTYEANGVKLTDWIKEVIQKNDAKNAFCKECKLP